MEIIRTDNPASEAGKELSKIISDNYSSPILLLVSGGSAFSILQYCDTSLFEDNITIGVLDERYSNDPLINNYLQLKETLFFKVATSLGAHTIDSSINKGESISDVATRLEQTVKNWIDTHTGGKVFVTMGIGEDSHTAGIMPSVYPLPLDENKLVIAYSFLKEVNQYTDRITFTFSFLRNHVDEAIVYAVGENKQQVIASLEETKSLQDSPVHVLKEMNSVKIFTNNIR